MYNEIKNGNATTLRDLKFSELTAVVKDFLWLDGDQNCPTSLAASEVANLVLEVLDGTAGSENMTCEHVIRLAAHDWTQTNIGKA